MGDTGLYDADIYQWSERQGAALRSLAARRDLPNDLDLENVAEEIESVGRSQLHSVQRFIRLILSHALLCALDPEAQPVKHWAAEAVVWQADLNDLFTAATARDVDLSKAWQHALRQCRAKLVEFDRAIALCALDQVPERECPIELADITPAKFDFPALVASVRERLAATSA